MPKRERDFSCGWSHKKFDRRKQKSGRDTVVLERYEEDLPQHKKRSPEIYQGEVLNKSRVHQQWNESFDRLVEFKRTHGHWKVPHSYEKDKSLATWVEYQRINRGTMEAELVRWLDSVGFPWSGDDDAMEAAELVSESDRNDLETTNDRRDGKDDEEEDREVLNDSCGGYVRGTKVKKFFNGSGWWSGKVTSYDGKRYHVLYEDGEVEKYTAKQMEPIVLSPELEKIEIGCRVSVHWPHDDKYYEATVTRERNRKQPFCVVYDNGGEYEWVDFRERKFRIIESKGGLGDTESTSEKNEGQQRTTASTQQRYANGTQVKQFFRGFGWVKGKVLSHNGCRYRVIYEDDDIMEYDEEELSTIVDLSKIEIGSRLAVHWPDDDTYYEATVTEERNQQNGFCIEYEYTDEFEWVDLHERKFRLLEGRTCRRKVEELEDDSDSDTDGDWDYDSDSDMDFDSEDEQ